MIFVLACCVHIFNVVVVDKPAYKRAAYHSQFFHAFKVCRLLSIELVSILSSANVCATGAGICAVINKKKHR